MLYSKSNALRVAEATVGKIKTVSRPTVKFILHILELWLSMNCRYVFTNMERWSEREEKSYCGMIRNLFDWFAFKLQLVKKYSGTEITCVFGTAFIDKSGKLPYGLGPFCRATAGHG